MLIPCVVVLTLMVGVPPGYGQAFADSTRVTRLAVPPGLDSLIVARLVPVHLVPYTGGVRIKSRNVARPQVLLRPRIIPQALSTADSARIYAGITPQDLALMEARLAQRIDRRFQDLVLAQEALARAGGSQVVVVQGDAQTPPDTTGAPLGAAGAPPARVPTPERPPIDTPLPTAQMPTIEYIERAILEQGLFRSAQVLFEINESTLASFSTLDAVGDVLQRYPDVSLEIGGHTDSTGPEDFNQRLSEARAAAVQRYLIETFGLSSERLTARGYGEHQPLADNGSSIGRTLNRRVEFRVTNQP